MIVGRSYATDGKRAHNATSVTETVPAKDAAASHPSQSETVKQLSSANPVPAQGNAHLSIAPGDARSSFFSGSRAAAERAQRQQWLDSYLRVRGHEPSAHEIEDFERRQFERH